MKLRSATPSLLALAAAAALVLQGSGALAFTLQGFSMGLDWRFFRVFPNFTGAANDNATPDPDFPGYTGATLAIWKGVAEWGSQPQGGGGADPHQPGGIGSGGANFDSVFQGENSVPGSPSGNTFSAAPLALLCALNARSCRASMLRFLSRRNFMIASGKANFSSWYCRQRMSNKLMASS